MIVAGSVRDRSLMQARSSQSSERRLRRSFATLQDDSRFWESWRSRARTIGGTCASRWQQLMSLDLW
jgi:hypothetical protein